MTQRLAARTRIAPSPTGDPHVGTAYQAVFNKALAEASGGQFLLRIEDTDRVRFNAASEGMIFRALHWLGLHWDEGPDVGGPHAPYRQSERLAIYASHAGDLIARGAAYRCFCAPERLERLRAAQSATKQPPRYDRACSPLNAAESARRGASEPHVVRLRIPPSGTTVVKDLIRGDIPFDNALLDDQVLLKSDGYPTYHLAVVVDDHEMGITHVVRGEEWIPSTPKHLLLYAAFGWTPPLHCHTPLLRNPDRTKLSKRKNPTSLEWFKAQGYLPEALVNFLCTMGWSHPDGLDKFSWAEFCDRFTLERIHLGGPIFDIAKLDHLNGLWIRSLSVEEVGRRVVDGGFTRHGSAAPELLHGALALVHDRLAKLSQFDDLTGFFFEEPASDATAMKDQADGAAIAGAFREAIGGLEGANEWSVPAIDAVMRGVAASGALTKKDLFMAARLAVTGRSVSTPLFETMHVIGRERSLSRLRAAVTALNAT
jgi:glutamyl-tRNA synthetase